jgi:hypothetical protein
MVGTQVSRGLSRLVVAVEEAFNSPLEPMVGQPGDVPLITADTPKTQSSLLLRYRETTAVEKVSTVMPVVAVAALVVLA